MAGIYPVTLIKELEAAALYTLNTLNEGSFKVRGHLAMLIIFVLTLLWTGDIFLVCNAGGSTVDLTAYKVKELTTQLELEEMGGTGKSILCRRSST
jgi:hypothetical protein